MRDRHVQTAAYSHRLGLRNDLGYRSPDEYGDGLPARPPQQGVRQQGTSSPTRQCAGSVGNGRRAGHSRAAPLIVGRDTSTEATASPTTEQNLVAACAHDHDLRDNGSDVLRGRASTGSRVAAGGPARPPVAPTAGSRRTLPPASGWRGLERRDRIRDTAGEGGAEAGGCGGRRKTVPATTAPAQRRGSGSHRRPAITAGRNNPPSQRLRTPATAVPETSPSWGSRVHRPVQPHGRRPAHRVRAINQRRSRSIDHSPRKPQNHERQQPMPERDPDHERDTGNAGGPR